MSPILHSQMFHRPVESFEFFSYFQSCASGTTDQGNTKEAYSVTVNRSRRFPPVRIYSLGLLPQKPPTFRTTRTSKWPTRSTREAQQKVPSTWQTMLKVFGRQISSSRSKRLSPFTLPVAGGKLFSQMKEKCTVGDTSILVRF